MIQNVIRNMWYISWLGYEILSISRSPTGRGGGGTAYLLSSSLSYLMLFCCFLSFAVHLPSGIVTLSLLSNSRTFLPWRLADVLVVTNEALSPRSPCKILKGLIQTQGFFLSLLSKPGRGQVLLVTCHMSLEQSPAVLRTEPHTFTVVGIQPLACVCLHALHKAAQAAEGQAACWWTSGCGVGAAGQQWMWSGLRCYIAAKVSLHFHWALSSKAWDYGHDTWDRAPHLVCVYVCVGRGRMAAL